MIVWPAAARLARRRKRAHARARASRGAAVLSKTCDIMITLNKFLTTKSDQYSMPHYRMLYQILSIVVLMNHIDNKQTIVINRKCLSISMCGSHRHAQGAVNKFVAGKPRASSELALARDCRAAPRPWVRPIATLFVNWRLELRILADH